MHLLATFLHKLKKIYRIGLMRRKNKDSLTLSPSFPNQLTLAPKNGINGQKTQHVSSPFPNKPT
jgi:hypothetical protein